MLNENPLVSVIIPVYNSEKFLKPCLDSILAQSFKNWEVLLVNDGSFDSSALICENYSKRDLRISVIHQENKGVTAARREGVSHAIGKYVTFVDSDDYLESDALQIMLTAATSDDEVIIANYPCTEMLTLNEYVVKLLENAVPWGPWGKLFLRTLFDDEVFNTPRYFTIGEDLLMQLKIAKKLKSKIHCLGCHVYNLRYNQESVTQTRKYSVEYERLFISNIIKLTDCFSFNVSEAIFRIKMNSLRMLIKKGVRIQYTDDWMISLIAESKSYSLTYTDKIVLDIRNYYVCRFLLRLHCCPVKVPDDYYKV